MARKLPSVGGNFPYLYRHTEILGFKLGSLKICENIVKYLSNKSVECDHPVAVWGGQRYLAVFGNWHQ